jgi:hypothetical protein
VRKKANQLLNEKNHPFFLTVAKTVAEPGQALRLNLKVQNIYIKPVLTFKNAYNK